MSIPLVQDLGGVLLLDTRHGGVSGTIGVYLLPLDGDAFALVETGPGSTLRTLRAGIDEAGFELEHLEAILVTHIHLDHAGAAGELTKATGARLYVHERGAKHLIDPSRLMASAERVYGNQLGSLWGTMEPAPEDRVQSLADGDRIELSGRTLEAIDSAGHATHHHCFLLDDGSLLTGDAAAVRLPGSRVIRPALPPPEADLETWEATIAKLRKREPSRLLLTHFGEVRDADAHLERIPRRNRAWADEVLEGMQTGDDFEALVRRMRALELAELVADGAEATTIERHRRTSDAHMTVLGLTRYWKKHHPELVPDKASPSPDA